MDVALFLGIGVGEYDQDQVQLERAIPNVEEFAGLLPATFESTVVRNPDLRTVVERLGEFRGVMPDGGVLVLLWSGHAIFTPEHDLHLLTRTGRTSWLETVSAMSIAEWGVTTGASQLLFIFDTCFTGAGATHEAAKQVLLHAQPVGEHVWVGVLASCLPVEEALDGVFGRQLIKMLRMGPSMPELRARWSRAALIRGDDLGDAVVKEWDSFASPPVFLGKGDAMGMLPNPLHKAGYVFISYVREDSLNVDRLQRLIETAGAHVWRDTADLWPGEDWRAKIRQAITKDSLVFLACFSRNSMARNTTYQNEELNLAIDQIRRRRPDEPWLIPVRFDDSDIPDFEIGGGRTLASIQRADLFGDRYDQNAAQLAGAVQRILYSRTSD